MCQQALEIVKNSVGLIHIETPCYFLGNSRRFSSTSSLDQLIPTLGGSSNRNFRHHHYQLLTFQGHKVHSFIDNIPGIHQSALIVFRFQT